MASSPVTEPFPISKIADRYLLFDVDLISYARREYNITGVLIGTIPNLSQQNVFLGIPLELMPEEARVLVERGHAFIVDDVEAHRKGFTETTREERMAYMRDMDRQGLERAEEARRKLEERSKVALKKKGLKIKENGKAEVASASESPSSKEDSIDDGESLFDAPTPPPSQSAVKLPQKKLDMHYITPATSYPPLALPTPRSPASLLFSSGLPKVPKSYPLFRYMHSQGYFSMPGLRFGCHYSIYPGDPLRFHSHFLATGLGWDEEFELLDIVGGGRLGTGVKKAYLIGGEDPSVKARTKIKVENSEQESQTTVADSAGGATLFGILQADNADEEKPTPQPNHQQLETVRPFSIEWAGF